MKKTLIISLVFVSFFPRFACASTEREKAELARISSELSYLMQEVLTISKLRRGDDLEAFNYEALIKDLDSVQKAVERHINGPSRQPKILKPLEVEYGSVQ